MNPRQGLEVCGRMLPVLGLLLGNPHARAAESPVEASPTNPVTAPVSSPLTLDAAVATALRDNAQLKSLRARWEAMLERPAQTGALPNPMLAYSGSDTASGGTWPDTNEKRIMVAQTFPWFGKRDLRAGIARKDAEAMLWELESMTRDIVMMVKETYFDFYATQRVIATTRKEASVLARMAKIAETMYSTGVRSQQDVLAARTEITMLKQRLLELDAQESTLAAKLNTLLDRQAGATLGAVVPPPGTEVNATLEALLAAAATNRPEVRVAQAKIDRYDLESKLMAKESAPDYQLGLEYRNISDGDEMVMFTVGLDLPVWSSRNRAGVREAEKMRESSLAARQAAERNSALDVQDASFKLQTARRMLALYKSELIPQAEARFQSSESGYQTGSVDFMDFLESQRFLLNARVMAAMAEGSVGMNFARLERATGTDLAPGINAGAGKP